MIRLRAEGMNEAAIVGTVQSGECFQELASKGAASRNVAAVPLTRGNSRSSTTPGTPISLNVL